MLVKHSSYTLEQTEGPYISGTVWADQDVNDCFEQLESLIIDKLAKKLEHNALMKKNPIFLEFLFRLQVHFLSFLHSGFLLIKSLSL